MLIAEIRRKLPEIDDIDPDDPAGAAEQVRKLLADSKEDLLTADVFGVLKYLPRRPFLEAVMRAIASRNPHAFEFHTHLDKLEANLDDLAFRFWPTYPTPKGLNGNATEPDVELTGPRTLMLFEAKLSSRFGLTQVERELSAAVTAAKGREPFLVLVTPSSVPPRFPNAHRRVQAHEYLLNLAVDGTLRRSLSLQLATNARRVLWISWDGILRALQSALSTFGDEAGERRFRASDLIDDLTTLMSMRGIRPFGGIGHVADTAAVDLDHRPVLGLVPFGGTHDEQWTPRFAQLAQGAPKHLGWRCPRRPTSDPTTIHVASVVEGLRYRPADLARRPIFRERTTPRGVRFPQLVEGSDVLDEPFQLLSD